MKTNDVASVVLFVNWLECFREIWAGLETRNLTSSSTRQLLFLTPAKISDRKYVVELVPIGCLLACFQWLSWKYRLNLLRHVVFIKESYEVVPRDFDTRVKLIYFSQFTDNMKTDMHVEHSEIHV
jgi:hypothetical protein